MTISMPSYELACLIGGEEEQGETRFDVVYPYTGEIVGSAPSLSPDTVRRALTKAGNAQVSLDHYERSRVLDRVADAIAEARGELASLITCRVGPLPRGHAPRGRARGRRLPLRGDRGAARRRRDAIAGDISPNGRPRRAYTMRESAWSPRSHRSTTRSTRSPTSSRRRSPPARRSSSSRPRRPRSRRSGCPRRSSRPVFPPTRPPIVTGDAASRSSTRCSPTRRSRSSPSPAASPVGHEIAQRARLPAHGARAGRERPADRARGCRSRRGCLTRGHRCDASNSGQRCTAVKRVLADVAIADELVERIERGSRPSASATRSTGDRRRNADRRAGRPRHRAARRSARSPTGRRFCAEASAAAHRSSRRCSTTSRRQSELVREETFGPAVPVIRIDGLARGDPGRERYALRRSPPASCRTTSRAIMRCVKELRCGTVNVREIPGFRTEQTPFGGIKATPGSVPRKGSSRQSAG